MKKKFILLIVLSLLVIGLAAFTIHAFSVPFTVTSVNENKTAELNIEQKTDIALIFMGGTWIDGITNCAYDYVFNYNGCTYRYHSECGTFCNITDKTCLELSEATQNKVNDILKSLFP